MGQKLDNRYVHPVGVVDVRELAAGGAPADDDGGSRKLLSLQRLAARDYHLAVDGDAGKAPRPGSRGEDDVARLQGPARPLDLHLCRAPQCSVPRDPLHPVLSEQRPHAPGQPVHDPTAPVDGRPEIVAQVVIPDAELLGAAEQREHLGVAQQRLAGDASPVEAHAAQILPLHHRRAHPQLCSPDGADVPSGPRAHNHHVVFRHGTLGLSGSTASRDNLGLYHAPTDAHSTTPP